MMDPGQPAVHEAVSSRSVQQLVDLLDQGEFIDLQDESGNTALHLATLQGYTGAVDLLIERHANLDLSNKSGDTPLHLAIKSTNEELVKKLLASGANCCQVDSDGNSPLCLASIRDFAAGVESLLEYTVDITSCNRDGHTLLHLLVLQRNASVLEKVLNKSQRKNGLNRIVRSAVQLAIVTNFEQGFQLLLEGTVDLFYLDSDGRSATAHLAVITGNHNIIQKLFNIMGRFMLCGIRDFEGRTAFELAVSIDQQFTVGLFLAKQIYISEQTAEPMYPLHAAVLEMNKTLLDELLSVDCDVDKNDKKRSTPLHWAIVRNFGHGVDRLLLKGASVNEQDLSGNAALHLAIQRKNLSLMDTLLSKGAEINQENRSRMSPLHLAVREHFDEGVDLLLERGANGTGVDERGNTLLHTAMLAGRSRGNNILKMLLEIQGIDIDKQNHSQDTALHLAVKDGLESFVSLLVGKGADANRRDSNGFTALHTAVSQNEEKRNINLIISLLDNGAIKELKNNYLKTSLHLAALSKYTAAVRLLLQRGTGVHERDGMGSTPLHSAVTGSERDTSTTSIVELLIGYNSDVNYSNLNGITPLHLAAKQGLEAIVDRLIDQDADVNKLDSFNESPLHKSVSETCESGKTVEILLIRGVDKNIKNQDGNTALHLAVRNSFETGVKVLLKYGADVNGVNNYMETPLTLAANQSNRTILEILIAAGAVLNHRNRTERTAFLVAVAAQKYNNVELLLRHGMSIDERKTAVNSALFVVLESRYFSLWTINKKVIKNNMIIIKILLKYGADINVKSTEGTSVLHLAAMDMNEPVVELFIDNNAKFDELDTCGDTLLHIAVSRQWFGIARKLVDKGADTRVRNSMGKTALQLAVGAIEHYKSVICLDNGGLQKRMEILKILTSISSDSNIKNNDKLSTTYYAAAVHLKDVLCILLESEVITTPYVGTNDGEILLYAAVKMDRDLIKQLVDKNVDVNYKNSIIKKTALHLSVLSSFNWGVVALTNAGALVNATESMRNTPLHLAAIVQSVPIMRTLLDRAAEVDAENEDGRTALHWAALFDCTDGVELLLGRGALLDRQDCDGNTPLHLALFSSGSNTIVSLIEAGARMDINNREQKSVLSMHLSLEQYFSLKIERLFVALGSAFAEWMTSTEFHAHSRHWDYELLTRFEARCEAELSMMRSMRYNSQTLFDVLAGSKDPHFVTNSKLKEMLESAQLVKEFPIYAGMLRAKFRRAEWRYRRLNSASRVPLLIEGGNERAVQLPPEMVRRIMSELSDEDLVNALNAFNIGS